MRYNILKTLLSSILLIALLICGCGSKEKVIFSSDEALTYANAFKQNEELYNKTFAKKYVEMYGLVTDVDENNGNVALIFQTDSPFGFKDIAAAAILADSKDPNFQKIRNNAFVVVRGIMDEGWYQRNANLYAVRITDAKITQVLAIKDYGSNKPLNLFPDVAKFLDEHQYKASPDIERKRVFSILNTAK